MAQLNEYTGDHLYRSLSLGNGSKINSGNYCQFSEQAPAQ